MKNLFIGLSISFLSIYFVGFIVHCLISDYSFIGQFPRQECDYILPKGASLSVNKYGEYRVKLVKERLLIDLYLSKYNFGIYSLESVVSESATVWTDSCKAKYFAKQYFELKERKTNFKEIR